LFADQELNVEHSGLGDCSRLSQNLKAFSGGTNGVKILKKNSMELRASEILALCGPARISSVDGGHTAACASNDVRLRSFGTAFWVPL